MSSYGGFVAVLVVTTGFVLTAVLLPTLATPVLVAPTRARLGFAGATEAFHVRTCGCKNDWDVASDERVLSNTYFQQNGSVVDPRGLSSLVAFWGQFIDHDIVLSVTDTEAPAFTLPMLPYTTPLTLRPNVKRTNPDTGCFEHKTENTPEIDATTVYGDSIRSGVLASLRNGTTCRMRVADGNLLPKSGMHWEAGDPRVTEHAVLSALHTLWVREHNRWCDVLETDLPEWSEEERFWKARQLVIVSIQKITYADWLPALFGSLHTLLYTEPPRAPGTSMSAEFSVVAYRFGHTMIPNEIGAFQLVELFFNTSILEHYGVGTMLNASFSTPAERVDAHVVDGLRNFMFSTNHGTIGEDLETRNLFRARETGIATYTQLAQCYNQAPINPIAQHEDATLGVLLEPVVPGSSMPPLIAHVVAEQFRRIRDNDLFFYTRLPQDQYVREAACVTLSQVIARSTSLAHVPVDVFRV